MSWLEKWKQDGIPEWATAKHTVQMVEQYRNFWVDTNSSLAERISRVSMTKEERIADLDKVMDTKFPGSLERLNFIRARYTTLRSFDPMTEEDLACKNIEETLAYSELCATITPQILEAANQVFGTPVYKIPDQPEQASEEGMI